jgi:hypothetical protein
MWATSRGRSYGPYGITLAPPEDEIAALEESKKYLQEELKGLEARIQELQKPPKKESA